MQAVLTHLRLGLEAPALLREFFLGAAAEDEVSRDGAADGADDAGAEGGNGSKANGRASPAPAPFIMATNWAAPTGHGWWYRTNAGSSNQSLLNPAVRSCESVAVGVCILLLGGIDDVY